MILLEMSNKVVEATLTHKYKTVLKGGRLDYIDTSFVDFDNALLRISNFKGNKNKICISIHLALFADLKDNGLMDMLNRDYGEMLIEAEEDFCITLLLDLSTVPENWQEVVSKIGLLKRNCFASVFEKQFDALENFVEDQQVVIGDGYFTIQTKSDRVVVTITIIFKDDSDMAIGKTFLQEFRDCKRAQQTAPQVMFTLEPGNKALVTFVLLEKHTNMDARGRTIDLILMFRQYIQYHVKCSKAYIHCRMRNRTQEFLRVLDRAIPESENAPKKTYSGKIFTRNE